MKLELRKEMYDVEFDGWIVPADIEDRKITLKGMGVHISIPSVIVKKRGVPKNSSLVVPRKFWVAPQKKDDSGFVHLHLHTHHSVCDSLIRPWALASKLLLMGRKECAITNHGTMHGWGEFSSTLRSFGLKPIAGMEAYYTPKVKNKERHSYHITLLGKNAKGLANLKKLATRANHDEGAFYYRPRVDDEMLNEDCDGIYCLSGCMGSRFVNLVLAGKEKEAFEWAKMMQGIFGQSFYLEIQPHAMEGYDKGNKAAIRASDKFGIPLCATQDSHYLEPSDEETHRALIAIGRRQTLKETEGYGADTFDVASGERMFQLFEKNHPWIERVYVEAAIENTRAISDSVEDSPENSSLKVPSAPEGFDLKKEAKRGLRKRFNGERPPKEYRKRLKYELGVLQEKKFDGYFGVLCGALDEADRLGIARGPGRGSVAGSCVAWALGISGLDPIKHGLIFERFLNPGRENSNPDIDLDFDSNRRDEVTNWLSERYETAKISTYSTMQGRGAIRDVCRILEIDPKVAGLASSLVQYGLSLRQSAYKNPQLKELWREQGSEFLNLAEKLEGVIRAIGCHPAGIIVTDNPIQEVLAVGRATGGGRAVQGDMAEVERVGLIKYDLLALRYVTAIAQAEKTSGVNVTDVPLDDSKVYDLFCSAETADIFQFGSDFLIRVLKQVQPRDFKTITAINALVRPGAMDFIDDFARGWSSINIKEIEHIVADTRGIILYQEQAMRIAHEVAGMSLSDADELRRSISKKKIADMKRFRIRFVKGCRKNGMKRRKAEILFDIIEKSGSYQFNLSHAASYSLLAYQCAWMRVHHPADWFAALLSAFSGKEEIPEYIELAESNGVRVLPPSIKSSEWGFKLEKNGKTKAIRCGFGTIKGVGPSTGKILSKAVGWIKKIEDVEKFGIGGAAGKALASAGAFDCFGIDRGRVWNWFDGKKGKRIMPDKEAEWSSAEKRKMEFSVLGMNLGDET